jgi:cell wall assembly regulator SMI1
LSPLSAASPPRGLALVASIRRSFYKLDGSESKNTLTFQGNSIDQVSKTNALPVDTAMNFDGNQDSVTMAMSLDSSGNLVVASTRPDFQGGGAPVTTKTSYKKAD